MEELGVWLSVGCVMWLTEMNANYRRDKKKHTKLLQTITTVVNVYLWLFVMLQNPALFRLEQLRIS